jgi:hypothetical protein
VEVYYNGTWGTICDDGWGGIEDYVVCRQLGFQDADYDNAYYQHSYNERDHYHGSNMRDGIGQIWLDELNCIGDESSLFSCRHGGLGIHDCDHSEDVGVRCRGENRNVNIFMNGICKYAAAKEIVFNLFVRYW